MKNTIFFSVLNLRTPTRIGDHLYIDGGVGGNCPLAQAIPRMRELSKVGHPNSVLSISPPRFVVGELKKRIFRLKTKKLIERTHLTTILSLI